MNYLVLRRSPDWRDFCLEDTRAFCRSLDLPETLVLDYAAQWDSQFALSFLEYRHRLKQVAGRCAARVSDAQVISHQDLDQILIEDDDLVYFTDDDDWVSDRLFAVLAQEPRGGDGYVWPSIVVASRYEPDTDAHSALVAARPFVGEIHTNSYAVRGEALKRIGAAGVLEHYHAEIAFKAGALKLAEVEVPLSAANKHLCCTTFIARPMRGVARPDDLRAAMAGLQAGLSQAGEAADVPWLRTPLLEYMAVNADAMGTPD